MSPNALIKVRRLTTTRHRAESAWRNAIREAVADGASLRAVGAAARITHGRVLQIVREEPPDSSWQYEHDHAQVARRRGRPKECTVCGTTDPEKIYDWANLSGNHGDVDDYARMCRRCHRGFDRERRANPDMPPAEVLARVRATARRAGEGDGQS